MALYILNLKFPLEGEWDKKSEQIEKICKKYKGTFVGSGSDGVVRDMQFDVKDSLQVPSMKNEIKEKYPDVTFF